MGKFRAIDVLSLLGNRQLNHSSYDFERLILFLTGSACYNDRDLKAAQNLLRAQFPFINQINIRLEEDYLKYFKNNPNSFRKSIEWARKALNQQHEEWVDIESPYGNQFYQEPDLSKSYPIFVEDEAGGYYTYPRVIQFPN